MRQPTPLHRQLAWWRAALAGEKPAMHDSTPQCGFYRRKLIKGGPYVAARIVLIQVVDDETGELTEPERFFCEVDGRPADAHDQWTWLCGEPIAEDDYWLMRRRAVWAGQHAPDHPIANPTKAVDWSSARIPF